MKESRLATAFCLECHYLFGLGSNFKLSKLLVRRVTHETFDMLELFHVKSCDISDLMKSNTDKVPVAFLNVSLSRTTVVS